jgi:hypothetical protein
MHEPMGARSTLWIAAIVTAAATAYALHETYVAHTSIDGVPVPARYLEPNVTSVEAKLAAE